MYLKMSKNYYRHTEILNLFNCCGILININIKI